MRAVLSKDSVSFTLSKKEFDKMIKEYKSSKISHKYMNNVLTAYLKELVESVSIMRGEK